MMSMFLPIARRRFKVGDKVSYKNGSNIVHLVIETGWKHITPTIRLQKLASIMVEEDFKLAKTVGFEITDD